MHYISTERLETYNTLFFNSYIRIQNKLNLVELKIYLEFLVAITKIVYLLTHFKQDTDNTRC